MEILATKLHMPQPHAVSIPRNRLTERFEDAVSSGIRLILLTAPAGFGKTTLVTQWLNHQDRQVGWLSLDKGDQQISHFLVYLVSAFQVISMEIGGKILSPLQTTENPPIENILPVLLNDVIEHAQDSILVLEDYQEINNPEIDEVVSYLLENLPQNLTLVITTRVYPDLSLSRLRVRGQLLEIRADDLRFSTDEVRHFLNQNLHLSLTADQLRMLHQQTEGWAAGLQLAALSLENETDQGAFIDQFSGRHRYITDYLTEEVLCRLPGEIQNFLLETSITERMCPALCNAMLGIEDSQEILAYLEKHNLFVIPLDNKRVWYRYHHLFAGLLRSRLQNRSAEKMVALSRAASVWCGEQGHGNEALDYAFASGDMEFAASVLEPIAFEYARGGRNREVVRRVNALPEEIVASHGMLSLTFALSSILLGQFEHVEEAILAAEGHQDVPAMITRATRVWLESILNGGATVIEDVKELIGHIPDTDPFYRLMLMVLGQAYEELNDLPKARETYLRGISLVEDWTTTRGLLDVIQGVAISDYELAGISATIEWAEKLEATAAKYEEQIGLPVAYQKYALVLQALVCYERNQLELCIQYCQKALEAAKRTREPYNRAIRDAYHLLVRSALANEDTVTAAHWLDLNNHAVENEILSPLIKNSILQGQIEYWIHLGDHSKLQSWITETNRGLGNTPEQAHEGEYLLLARWAVQYQDPETVLPLLNVIFENASKRKHLRTMVRTLALSSLAYQKLGRRTKALSTLETALEYAESGGYVRSLLDMGPGVLDLLLILASRKNKHPYLDQLLQQARQDVPAARSLNGLTDREMDVLGLIARGMSNNDIADRLVIAVGTVKRHTANIYSKLYASNRTEAVAKARESGLLD